MKICKIIIKDFQQFKDFEIDLTHPETGEPLEKVCFIGSNGTGKTTLLRLLNGYLSITKSRSDNSKLFLKVKNGDEVFYSAKLATHAKAYYFNLKEEIQNNEGWYQHIVSLMKSQKVSPFETKKDISNDYLLNSNRILFKNRIPPFQEDKLYSVIFQPSEVQQNNYINIQDVPNENLNNALNLFNHFPKIHEVSANTINAFWQTLIYQIKQRENQFLKFQNQEENQDKTIRQVKAEFNKKYPKILDEIAKLWNRILEKVGLEFDVESASNPIQLNDNLKAYIQTIQTKDKIAYNQLSTGIRNFIFKLGHIFSLYFNRKIDTGFLLIDEPENSLFPDFLYDLVDIYTEIAQNTQIFMATHNPIIAAQFEPYERFILEFNDQGYVKARRGTVPAGDDPNDILIKDFGIRSILGKKGVEMWERYIELKTLIPFEKNPTTKFQMIQEFSKIGTAYNFGEEEHRKVTTPTL